MFVYTGVSQNVHSKYEYIEDENNIFGQTIWLLHSFFQNKSTKRLVSPEREGFRGSNFDRCIKGLYMFYY